MIPTMLLVGFVIARWWAIPVGALTWVALLLTFASIGLQDVPLAAALGAANTTAGLLTRLALRLGVRGVAGATVGA